MLQARVDMFSYQLPARVESCAPYVSTKKKGPIFLSEDGALQAQRNVNSGRHRTHTRTEYMRTPIRSSTPQPATGVLHRSPFPLSLKAGGTRRSLSNASNGSRANGGPRSRWRLNNNRIRKHGDTRPYSLPRQRALSRGKARKPKRTPGGYPPH